VSGLAATLMMYRKVGGRAAELVQRNWTVLLSVFVYLGIIAAASAVVSLIALSGGPFFALAGGLALTLVAAACVASFLYLVEMMVRTSRVNLADFRRSFTPYLPDVVGVSFVLWLFFRLAGPLILSLPQGATIMVGIEIVLIVFLNAVPELIYLGHHSTLALLGESYRFISENWIEWFPPNFVMLAVILLLRSPETEGVFWLAQTAAVTLAAYFFMVMRGLLFLELSGSSRRGRIFRYRMEQ
jgi:hypothetical protein